MFKYVLFLIIWVNIYAAQYVCSDEITSSRMMEYNSSWRAGGSDVKGQEYYSLLRYDKNAVTAKILVRYYKNFTKGLFKYTHDKTSLYLGYMVQTRIYDLNNNIVITTREEYYTCTGNELSQDSKWNIFPLQNNTSYSRTLDIIENKEVMLEDN